MGPYDSISDRLEVIALMIVPYSFLALLFVLSVVSVPYPLAAVLRAPLLLMAIYYWAVYRPSMMPPWLVFTAGLLFDLLAGMTFTGLSAVLFLLCRMAVIDQRRFLTGQAFTMVWFGFCVLDIAFHLLQWGLFSTLSLQLFPLKDFVPSLVLGVALFPLIYIFLHMTHKILPQPVSRAKSRLASQKPDMPL